MTELEKLAESAKRGDAHAFSLLYESVYKNLDSFISQLQVSVCSIKEINLFEDVHKGDLDEPKEQVIDAVRTIKKIAGVYDFSKFCRKAEAFFKRKGKTAGTGYV